MILGFFAGARVCAAACLLTFILHHYEGRRLITQRSKSRRFFHSRSLIFIDDWPRDRLLVTDYGGYLNLLNSAVTFGLAQSEEAVARSYRDAALDYLVQSQLSCSQRRSKDLGDRTFEIFYRCNTRNCRLVA